MSIARYVHGIEGKEERDSDLERESKEYQVNDREDPAVNGTSLVTHYQERKLKIQTTNCKNAFLGTYLTIEQNSTTPKYWFYLERT